MPLPAKGAKILANMTKEYGSAKRGKQVFYASVNSGKITGADPNMERSRGKRIMRNARKAAGV